MIRLFLWYQLLSYHHHVFSGCLMIVFLSFSDSNDIFWENSGENISWGCWWLLLYAHMYLYKCYFMRYMCCYTCLLSYPGNHLPAMHCSLFTNAPSVRYRATFETIFHEQGLVCNLLCHIFALSKLVSLYYAVSITFWFLSGVVVSHAHNPQ